MARIIANVLICLVILCSIINAKENDETVVQDETSQSVYKSPELSGFAYLVETFDDEEKFKNTWILSEAKKDSIDEDIAKYDGIWSLEEPKRHAQDGDMGLALKSKARHAAVSSLLTKPFYFKDSPLIVQYEVNFQEGQECGGAYLKLLSLDPEHKDLKKFHDKTPYSIMFGPDKCGNDHKLHFIFRHKNPLNGTIEEKHCKKPKERLEDFFKDKQPHLYTLIVRPDNTFEIKVDNKLVNSGSLLDDFNPPVNPPLEIEDPTDVQPKDWDDREKIPDPSAVKPDDWDEDAPAQIVDEDDKMPDGWLEDEPPMIPNPDSIKPEDWDNDMDGEWEPPEIPNPKCADVPGCGPFKQKMKKNPRYKGKWLPPLINNPNYKGKWKPRLIHNPDYFNDDHPFKMAPIYAIGFELWSMSTDILFDNILITDSEEVAEKWAADTFEATRSRIADESWDFMHRISAFVADHPWIWPVSIIAIGLAVLLLVYCCCFSFSQDKCDMKDEDKQSLEKNEETAEHEETEEKEEKEEKDEKEEKEEKDEKEEKEEKDEKEEKKEKEEKVEKVEKVEKEEKENLEASPKVEEATTKATDEADKSSETEEIIGSGDKEDQPTTGGDGPRRRKPNKE